MRYDLSLMLQLNDEYREKPVVPKPRSLEAGPLLETSRRRAANLDRQVGLRGKRVLEVGCGRGHFCEVLADEYDCSVSGVDVKRYSEWRDRPDLDLRVHDLAADDNGPLGRFDVIMSFAVWEHVHHPFASLSAARDLLQDDGRMYLYANLYRGRQASHRYREVYFPWPHLLFTDEVFEQFYEHIGDRPRPAAWVNKLTYAHYLTYFKLLELEPERIWTSPVWFDEEFYGRFEDVLGRYPRFDLERDFIHAIVKPGRPHRGYEYEDHSDECDRLRARVEELERQRQAKHRELERLRGSLSWRMTRPLRKVRKASKVFIN